MVLCEEGRLLALPERCWEALTSVSEMRNTSHDILMFDHFGLDVYDMLDLETDLHSSSPP